MATSAQVMEYVAPTEPRKPHVRPAASILSPLRYPGGKRRLASFIGATLRLNDLKPDLYVEPFAGGASVALQLAQDGDVERIALGEKDPDVAAFWDVVFHDHGWLCERVERAEVTLDEWNRIKASHPRSVRERAFRCLFLNRTSFSGILQPNAGPIGGQAQKSDYDVACRWNASTIVSRIEQAFALADRVAFVEAGTWSRTVARVKRTTSPRDAFFYFDPPFYVKGRRLYPHAFADAGHRALKRGIDKLESDWILSYDPAAFIVDLYGDHRHRQMEFLYTTSGEETARGRAAELVITSLERTPRATRLWRTNKEWRTPGARR